MDALRLSSEHRGACVVVVIEGDLDIVTSPRFDEFLTQVARKHHAIVLDLAGVDFMDTSSLAVIVRHWKKLAAEGGLLALARPRYRYTKTLWITGLAHRLPLYNSVEEAAKAVPAGAD